MILVAFIFLLKGKLIYFTAGEPYRSSTRLYNFSHTEIAGIQVESTLKTRGMKGCYVYFSNKGDGDVV